jgi:hypothetical protein
MEQSFSLPILRIEDRSKRLLRTRLNFYRKSEMPCFLWNSIILQRYHSAWLDIHKVILTLLRCQSLKFFQHVSFYLKWFDNPRISYKCHYHFFIDGPHLQKLRLSDASDLSVFFLFLFTNIFFLIRILYCLH